MNIAIFLLFPALLLIMFSYLFLKNKYFGIAFNGILATIVASIIGGILNGLWVFLYGGYELNILQGVTFRIDELSTVIYTMISIIAFVVVKFSKNYLDGDLGQTRFLSKLAFTVAFVLLFAISGHLVIMFIAWVCTSIGLQRILMFYPERRKAVLAAKKKFLIARIGDVSLLAAFFLIYMETGSGNLTEIFLDLKEFGLNQIPFKLKLSAGLIALSAMLKSVQLPSHVWILDVMEAPTPVSALLHAGLLNAGPYIIIRFAFLIDLVSFASILLIVVGATSAIFGVLSSTSQPSIKTALTYSSIGHMGFTLFVCGLGIYSAALLHLVAHSFYKAHAFLSAGSAIDSINIDTSKNEIPTSKIKNKLIGLVVAAVLFVACSYLWKISFNSDFQLLLICCIVFLGTSTLQIDVWSQLSMWKSTLQLMFISVLVINSFYFLEYVFHLQISNQIPETRILTSGFKILAVLILMLFSIVVVFRSWFNVAGKIELMRELEIHFRNGLYFNHITDRVLKSFSHSNYK